MRLARLIFYFAMSLTMHGHGSDISVISLGALQEVVSVDIHANSVAEAVKQLIDQGGKSSEVVKHLSIRVDDGFDPIEINQRLANVRVGSVLHRIISLLPARLDLNDNGTSFLIKRVTETDDNVVRDYYISDAARNLIALPLNSCNAAHRRLQDLGVQLGVTDVDQSKRRITLSGSRLQLKIFEMLVMSTTLAGIDMAGSTLHGDR